MIVRLRRFKDRLATLLQRLPVSSEIIGPPKGIVSSIGSWVTAYNARSPRVPAAFTPVHSGAEIRRPLPPSLDEPVHWKFRAAAQETAPATFVARIPQGRVWGRYGASLTPDDRLLAETAREFGRTAEQNSIFQQLKLVAARPVRGRVAVLATAGSDVYFHWMFDLLPRWRLLQLAGESAAVDRVVLDHQALPFQLESLAAIGLPPEKIIVARDHWHFHVKADELVIPALPAPLDSVSGWSCEFLRQTFLPAAPADTAPRRRLFISRRQAASRHLVNEEEVLAVLRPLGFEICLLEGLSIRHQAALFASAECIVAPHGAGLTNLVFCRPGTQVVDLFSPNWVNPCYWILSQHAGLSYRYLIGRGPRPPEQVDPAGKGDDILVDVGRLRETLHFVLGR